MIERAYCFTCDWCGRFESYLGNNEKEAKHTARIENWLMSGAHGCFCSRECYADYKRAEMARKEEQQNADKCMELFDV